MDSLNQGDHILSSIDGRATTLQSLHPDFEKYRCDEFAFQVQQTRSAIFAANEPLTQDADKHRAVSALLTRAKTENRHVHIGPVSARTAQKVDQTGATAIHLGDEPVFDLRNYEPPKFDHTTALIRRGFVVHETTKNELSDDDLAAMKTIYAQWLTQKQKRRILGYLNASDPFYHLEHKKIFTLKQGRKLFAFLLATPIPSSQGLREYFFSDYYKTREARVGSIEYLFIEAFKSLAAEGATQVTLGLVPFSGSGILHRFTRLLSRLSAQMPIAIDGLYEFKKKFKPTAWKPLYLITTARWQWPLDFFELYTRRKLFSYFYATLGVALVLAVVNLIEFFSSTGVTLYKSTGFSLADLTLWGWAAGPLFHNTPYHFWGDFLAFLVMGAILEFIAGTKTLTAVTIFGFWASNPITSILTAPVLWISQSPGLWQLWNERDYGSSNAIYAFAGAIASHTKNPRAVLIPFALNGLFLCFAKTSILSLHHLVALFGAYFVVSNYSKKTKVLGKGTPTTQ